jgi:hypothetical protein
MEGIQNLRTPIYFLSIQDCKHPPAKEATVPQIDNVVVRNIAANANWVTGQPATVPEDLPPPPVLESMSMPPIITNRLLVF